MSKYTTVAVAKEIESSENPRALDKRVSIIPSDIKKLVEAGLKIYVEKGAGIGIGYQDQEYLDSGATLQENNEIYKNKDLIIKLKGPSMDSIKQMKPGCTLFCMAHFYSYPDRAKLLEQQKVNVVAMEEIYEMPKSESDERILGRVFTKSCINKIVEQDTFKNTNVVVIGWDKKMVGVINRSLNKSAKSLKVMQNNSSLESLDSNTIYFYNSKKLTSNSKLLEVLTEKTNTFDIEKFIQESGPKDISKYRETHKPYELGLRRIQCLHETGRAGAKYGLELLEKSKPNLHKHDYTAVVLGYGNVAQGAIHELYLNGVKNISVLGRTQTSTENIEEWINNADIIVNGAEQPPQLRGKNFIIKNEHLKNNIPDGSVIIDLVGGSVTNRSAVEPVIACTFLTDPHFVQNEVYVSALWGWPMLGMMKESATRYSAQIVDVLLNKEKLIEGLEKIPTNIKKALVCGPFII